MMTGEQMLYTSCRRGIRGDASGFQFYSYTKQAEAWLGANALGKHFGYEPPYSGVPTLPTEEEARSLFPTRTVFAAADGPDGLCCMAVNSYIGRDYPENSQRPGNFLTHAVAAQAGAFAKTFPACYIGSPSFMTWMPRETARGTEAPAYLAPLAVEENARLSRAHVAEFLEQGERADAFRQMLACLLNRMDPETGQRRRLILLDAPENLPYWIAGLQMAFPCRLGAALSFSTFECLPCTADFDIVCTARNTCYSRSECEAAGCFCFDLTENEYDATDLTDMWDVCDLLYDGFFFAAEDVRAFETFLEGLAVPVPLGPELAAAHRLFLYLSGDGSLFELHSGRLARVVSFARAYAGGQRKRALAERLIDDVCSAAQDAEIRRVSADFLAEFGAGDSALAARLTDRAIAPFLAERADVESFSRVMEFSEACFAQMPGARDRLFLAALSEQSAEALQRLAEKPWKLMTVLPMLAAAAASPAELTDDTFHFRLLRDFAYCVRAQDGPLRQKMLSAAIRLYQERGAAYLDALYAVLHRYGADGDGLLTALRCARLDPKDTAGSCIRLVSLRASDAAETLLHFMLSQSAAGVVSLSEQLLRGCPDFYERQQDFLMRTALKNAASVSEKCELLLFAKEHRALERSAFSELLGETALAVALPDAGDAALAAAAKLAGAFGAEQLPDRMRLALLLDALSRLAKTADKLLSSESKTCAEAKRLCAERPRGFAEVSEREKRACLDRAASDVARIVQKTDYAQMQGALFSLSNDEAYGFVLDIFRCVAEQTRRQSGECVLRLLISDWAAYEGFIEDAAPLLADAGYTETATEKEMLRLAKKLGPVYAGARAGEDMPADYGAFSVDLVRRLTREKPRRRGLFDRGKR